MGFLDKASRSFSRAGEETVRVVDYDAVDPKEPVEKAPKEPKPAKEPKPPREKKRLGFSAAKDLLHKQTDEDPEASEEDDSEFQEMISAPLDALPTVEEPPLKKFPMAEETVFEIDDDEPNFYEEKQQLWEKSTAESELMPKDGAIQDVLDVLKIPATFTIAEEVLMPGDFEDVEFDIQVPQGYDVGQVQYFVERVETSVKEYLRLLELRNDHIARLATAVDRLQVDANNLKYDSQIAAGIGIMPTSESVDLENENMELKLQLQKLKDAQRTTLNSEERKLYEEMRNELSRLTRENEDLNEKNYELRTMVAQLEENADEMVTMPSELTEHESAEIIFQNMDDDDAMPGVEPNDGMPSLMEEALPDFSMPVSTQATAPAINSSFDVDEDDNDEILASFTEDPESAVESKSVAYLDEDDEDDELDQLMRDWKN